MLYSLSRVTPCNAESFHIGGPTLSITVNEVINRPVVILFKNGDMNHILTDKRFLCYFSHKIGAVATKNDNIINLRAIIKCIQPFSDRCQ